MGWMTFQFHLVVFLWSVTLRVVNKKYRVSCGKLRYNIFFKFRTLQITETTVFNYMFLFVATLFILWRFMVPKILKISKILSVTSFVSYLATYVTQVVVDVTWYYVTQRWLNSDWNVYCSKYWKRYTFVFIRKFIFEFSLGIP